MKTAVSLPDDIFRAAEQQAKRAGKSRSQLYAEALAEYLARHAPDEVTEAMDRVVERLDEPGPDPFLEAVASFWRGKSFEELATEPAVYAIDDLDKLSADWPDDADFDSFLSAVRSARA